MNPLQIIYISQKVCASVFVWDTNHCFFHKHTFVPYCFQVDLFNRLLKLVVNIETIRIWEQHDSCGLLKTFACKQWKCIVLFTMHFERNIAGDRTENIKWPVPSPCSFEIYSRLQRTLLQSILFFRNDCCCFLKSPGIRAHRKWKTFGGNRDIIVAFPLSQALWTDIQDHRWSGVVVVVGDGLSINRVEKEKGRKGSEAKSVFTQRESHTSSQKSCHWRVC